MILDLHIHTTISGDSIITPEDLIMAAKSAGLDAVCITEHGIEKSRIASDLARKYDFPVFGGLEASTELGDILVFGIDSYPRAISKARELKEFVEEAGGVLIAAHPFRSNFGRFSPNQRLTIDAACQSQFLRLVDAMEVINGWAREEEVIFCQNVSKKLGLNGTGGSDAHIPLQIGCCVTVFENSIRNEAELVAELKRGKFRAEDRRRPEQKDPVNWFR
ncbi:MAG: PHP domain-containing protein [Chloroflexota bacterium]|nr:PHP domain-containing protein [Chloroflexota bacterium]